MRKMTKSNISVGPFDLAELENIPPSEPNYLDMVHAVIGPLIPSGAPVVLFDFPNHSNVGDSAIWLGEEHYLALKLRAKIMAVDDHSLVGRTMRALPEGAVILIHGGGNLGDLYPLHQTLREHVITHYPRNRIIQLPQSVHFQDVGNEVRCRTVFNGHNDFHLLVRDRVSLALAESLHDGPTHLCPDMALCLGELPRTVSPHYPIVGLLRTDQEKVTADMPVVHDPETIFSADWLDEPISLTRRINARVKKMQANYPRWLGVLSGLKRPLYHQLAKERLKRGCDLLSTGQVVITDRLHAHILCCLLAIPHVVLDNSYRKISNFREAWGTGEGICQQADSLDEALKMAYGLLDETPPMRTGCPGFSFSDRRQE